MIGSFKTFISKMVFYFLIGLLFCVNFIDIVKLEKLKSVSIEKGIEKVIVNCKVKILTITFIVLYILIIFKFNTLFVVVFLFLIPIICLIKTIFNFYSNDNNFSFISECI